VVAANGTSATVVVPTGSGTVTVKATSGLGTGTQVSTFTYGQAPPADPLPGYPNFLNGKVNAIRNAGSDTTLFAMQKIDDLYTSAGLYGCTLNAGGEATLYNTTFLPSTTGNAGYYCQARADIATTDSVDNWDRTEVETGVDAVGSTTGQSQLCGNPVLNSPLPVDFATSSSPPGAACGTLVGVGYAKDAVPAVDFPVVNPSTFGAVLSTSPYAAVNGGRIGPVANGWIPGDPLGGPYSGMPFTDLFDTDNGGGANSTAYRLWCATGSTRISDWGQLTNLSASGPGNGGVAKSVGNGAPIGLPIRIMGVSPTAGANVIFAGFVNGNATTRCSNTNFNAAADPNPATASVPNVAHMALESNVSQISQYAASDFPADVASQAVEVATTLYYTSNGVLNTSPHSGGVSIGGQNITASKLSLNDLFPSTVLVLSNGYPTARVLWNVYKSDGVRASVGGFLNWICDDNSLIPKGIDRSTGVNFDTEISSIIGSFGFIRLDDQSTAAASQTPVDGLAAPNTTCASGTTTTGGQVQGNGHPAVTSAAVPNG
jgi:hypothetical protein